jgi:hypothetical protein
MINLVYPVFKSLITILSISLKLTLKLVGLTCLVPVGNYT